MALSGPQIGASQHIYNNEIDSGNNDDPGMFLIFWHIRSDFAKSGLERLLWSGSGCFNALKLMPKYAQSSVML